MKPLSSVMVVSRIRLLSQGLVHILANAKDLEVVFEGDIPDALGKLEILPDLMITCFRPKNDKPIEFLKAIRRECPNVKTIVIGVLTREEALACIEEDVSGFLLIDETSRKLLRVIRHVLQGQNHVFPRMKRVIQLKMRE